MDNLYDINFQSNNKIYKIYIRYNIICDLYSMHYFNHSFMIDINMTY
jgi:hypothetical protein